MVAARPTQNDVARLAGVSRQTVSLVTNRDPRVSDESRNAVIAAMKELGYRPNAAAKQLASNRSSTVGIVCSDLLNPYVAFQLEVVRRIAKDAGFDVSILPVDEAASAERSALDRLVEMGVAGVIMISPMADRDLLTEYGALLPLVVISRDLEVPEVSFVRPDDQAGAEMVTRHVIEQGYEPIFFVGPIRECEGDSTQLRFQGYSQQMMADGRQWRRIVVKDGDLAEVAAVLDEKAVGSAFICHNDKIALGIASILVEKGLAIGTDVGVAGYDNSYLSQYPGLGLTSVDMHIEILVHRAVRALSSMLAGQSFNEESDICPSLVIRNSTHKIK